MTDTPASESTTPTPTVAPAAEAPTMFRQAALAKMRSPDQLDSVIPITSPLSWLALATIAVMLVGVLIWSIFGTIVRTVSGDGIIFRDAEYGLTSVTSAGSGLVTKVLVKKGQEIHVGDAVATLDYSVQRKRLMDTRAVVETQKTERRASARDTLVMAAEVAERNEEQRILFEETVRSLWDGRVVEVVTDEGSFAGPSMSICNLESLTGSFEAVIYISAQDGARVKKGMGIKIAPGSIKSEEFGYMIGVIKDVAPYPTTREGMMTTLKNNEYCNRLLAGGDKVKLLATLKLDANTFSGFEWTSSQGPEVKIRSGMLCRALIVTERHRPINLLLPFLREFFGFDE